jgi:hypothetical protein
MAAAGPVEIGVGRVDVGRVGDGNPFSTVGTVAAVTGMADMPAATNAVTETAAAATLARLKRI